MATQNSRFIIADITWNVSGWRGVYVNPKAGHRYAQKNPGHESLNFEFNKKGLDTKDHVFGFVQWRGYPKTLLPDGVIFFYSKNLQGENKIVGVYGKVELIKPPVKTKWPGFENNMFLSNIKAAKDLSILFPISLDADRYRKGNKRLVPQAGFTYVDFHLASQILDDEIRQLRSGARKEEYEKLIRIYEFVTGQTYQQSMILSESQKDEEEQRELEDFDEIKKQSKVEIITELKSLGPQTPELVQYKGKSYKRDNKTITQLKKLRDYKCQICSHTIQKKNGGFYIEAAHIKMKSVKGAERPNNILILCPNHHKEFDFGKRNIIEHNDNRIIFDLNGKRYEVNLSLMA